MHAFISGKMILLVVVGAMKCVLTMALYVLYLQVFDGATVW